MKNRTPPHNWPPDGEDDWFDEDDDDAGATEDLPGAEPRHARRPRKGISGDESFCD